MLQSTTHPLAKDRRVFDRFLVSFPTKFLESLESFESDVFLCDASAKGARIKTKKEFMVGDKIAIQVKLPDRADLMDLSGSVSWRRKSSGQWWEVGLCFPDVNLFYMSRLYKLSLKKS